MSCYPFRCSRSCWTHRRRHPFPRLRCSPLRHLRCHPYRLYRCCSKRRSSRRCSPKESRLRRWEGAVSPARSSKPRRRRAHLRTPRQQRMSRQGERCWAKRRESATDEKDRPCVSYITKAAAAAKFGFYTLVGAGFSGRCRRITRRNSEGSLDAESPKRRMVLLLYDELSAPPAGGGGDEMVGGGLLPSLTGESTPRGAPGTVLPPAGAASGGAHSSVGASAEPGPAP